MASYLMKSKHEPAKIMDQALKFFGPTGAGLDVKEQQGNRLHFQGGGGYILVQVSETAQGSEVELETREWDYPVKKFMEQYS